MVKDAEEEGWTTVTRGTTYENRSNLAPSFFRQVIRRYEGTRRGQQELMGLLLEDVPGALWSRSIIKYAEALPTMRRVIVGVDPSVSDGEESAECGIVVAGEGANHYYYTLADYSLRGSPMEWGNRIIQAWQDFNVDLIVAEENNGGKIIEAMLKLLNPNIPYKGVRASDGKEARAQPVSMLYEQGRVFHAHPMNDLEDQLCSWVPGEGESPDRLDALVWTLKELALQRQFVV